MGYDPIQVLKVATLNPIQHYGLDVGLLQEGDWADFIIIDNLNDFNILKTYIDGELVAENSQTLLTFQKSSIINNFQANYKSPDDFVYLPKEKTIPIIKAIDGSLITDRFDYEPIIKIMMSNAIFKVIY